jgi:hypothetical protein
MPHWGIPTWIFLHTLIAKVNPDKYDTIKIELLKYVTSICNILPCPTCREHASTYIKKIKIQFLPNLDSFKRMLFDFHNHVNFRLKKKIYTYDYLSIYDNLNFAVIFNAFSIEFTKPLHDTRYISDVMFRQRKVFEIKEWLFKNKESLLL